MRVNVCRTGRLFLVAQILITLGLLANSCTAQARIYQWVDESGRFVYGDEPARLLYPPNAGQEKEIVPDSRLNTVQRKKGSTFGGPGGGEEVFAQHCGECHTITKEQPGKLRLFDRLIDRVTLLPKSKKKIFSLFSRAVSGAYSDMDRMEISDQDLEAIAEYARRAVSR